jgi:putative transposase
MPSLRALRCWSACYTGAMSWYKRATQPGGTFFFTLVTNQRQRLFEAASHVELLRSAFAAVRREMPFDVPAAVVLPDHLHFVMTLPPGDTDYAGRVGRIKVALTRSLPPALRQGMPTTGSRVRHRESGVWQRRYWEHMIRDEDDFRRHVEYIHYNPVKHGLTSCPHAWRWTSFHRWVSDGSYAHDWACRCQQPSQPPAHLESLAETCGE